MGKGEGYRLRAAKARQRANQASDSDIRNELLMLAESYDRLAAQAEDMSAHRPNSRNATDEQSAN